MDENQLYKYWKKSDRTGTWDIVHLTCIVTVEDIGEQ